MHSGSILLAIVVLSVSACTEARPTPAIGIRDSAGIQIIDNNLEQLSATCAISAEPNISIGDENAGEEYQLHRVFGATRMGDGRIAVVNSGTQQLRFYDRNGRFVSQTGRAGQGPGEFRDAFYLWLLPGDTIWVGDYPPWQFLVFSPDGRWVRTVRPQPDYHRPNESEVLRDGRVILASENSDYTTEQGVFNPWTITLMLHDREGALIDTIGTYPHGIWGRPTKDTNYNYRLFESFTQVDAAGTRLVIGQGARPELLVYNAEDSLRLERIVRWTTGDRAVTSQELQANRDRVTEQYKDLEPAARREAMEYELGKVRPVAEEFPAFGRLVIGRDGRFWVREFRRPSAPRPHQWIAFDSTGRFDCRATIPPFAELYEFGADYLLTLEQDSLDQEKVLQYSIGHAIETGR